MLEAPVVMSLPAVGNAHDRRHLLAEGMRAYTETGVIGRPSLATAERGRGVPDSLTGSFADVVALLAKL
ncbi:hypothetical protein [Streptosporangium saharense]|uniref:Creatinine amidohydrolase/Fe(II)-dependent formamide hydrolase-like protein n=1 Tax=Streptosporangium saharense TaxID=1706840 RepID=A0A7W7QNJ1_9ACTN|nr:hypothetical protein [Streptosporangium saharense]MBB4916881.1 creatinine amidohydrolase/Fe(II)-dependent formamide hydrolase-like protein [Streptosporangium saharense]